MGITDAISANVATRVGVSVARTALDVTQSQGEAAIALIQAAREIAEASASRPARDSLEHGRLDVVA